MTNGSILFAQPTRTSAFAVMAEALRRQYKVVALVASRQDVDKVWGENRALVGRIDRVVPVGPWESFTPDRQFLGEIAGLAGPVRGVFVNREEPIRAVNRLRGLIGHAPFTRTPDDLCGILNKHRLRTTLVRQGLSDLRFIPGRRADGLSVYPFPGPAMFKPMHGGGSRCVREVRTLADVRRARREWLASAGELEPVQDRYLHCDEDDFFLEEKVPGELLSVEGYTREGRYQPLGITSRVLYSQDATVELGHGFPYAHAEQPDILEFARAVHAAVGWQDGFTHLELLVRDPACRDGRRRFEAIDFNPRILGSFAWKNLTYALDFPIERALLDWALGLPVELPRPAASRVSLIQYVLAPRGLPRLESLTLPDDPRVVFRVQMVPPGPLRTWGRADDRLGGYLVVAPDHEQALRISRELRPQVRLNGSVPGVF
jgi:hypothetical protein